MYVSYDQNLLTFLDKKVRNYSHMEDTGHAVKRKFSNMNEEIDKYIEKIQTANNHHDFIGGLNSQYFTNEFVITDDVAYTVAWDIPKCVNTINSNADIKGYILDIEDHLLENIKFNETTGSPSLQPIDSPIIVAHYFPLNLMVVIDGNHRLNSKYKRGDKEIVGFVMDSANHMECMVSELSKILYIVHHNFTIISNYAAGFVEELKYERSFNANTIYPL